MHLITNLQDDEAENNTLVIDEEHEQHYSEYVIKNARLEE